MRRDAETIHVGDARGGIAHAGAERRTLPSPISATRPVDPSTTASRGGDLDEERDDLGDHVVVEVDDPHRDVIARQGQRVAPGRHDPRHG